MQTNNKTKIGWITVTAIVVANMVGSGIFTSLGFQLVSTTNTWSIILLWFLGAIMALFGAFSYAELGTNLIRSGGEYHFLSRIYHPVIGYLSGWISVTVGFAGPIGLAAMAIGEYTEAFTHFSPTPVAIIIILLITFFHLKDLNRSSNFQNITTGIKLSLLFILIIFGFCLSPEQSSIDWSSSWQSEIYLPAFAISFVYVTFSYSGWNAAAYIIDEIKDVQKNLPKILVLGTLIVSILYILINIVFLRHASLVQLQGQLEIGQIVSINMFGETSGIIISAAIAFMLISSISAMIWAGPRVTMVIAEDYQIWNYFKKKNKNNIPIRSIWLQSIIAIGLIITGTFEQVLIYSAFVLNLSTAITVAGVFILRRKGADKNAYKSKLYPIAQIIFLILSSWILVYLIYERPYESLFGLLNLLVGLGTYLFNRYLIK
ncbi:MAG: amino acid permease [Bacteroidetes bacterium]|nr:MAG: amino acid permease [Bacteroidota bacterium]